MPFPESGELVDERYLLGERLGDGGTASVFRAEDRQLGRAVAIKVYRGESAVSDAARRQKEARMLAGLRHPAIVTLFDARLDADPPYLVLELVDGESLDRRLARGPLPDAEARAIGAATAEGLVAAHAAGIVHRDIKPANLIIPDRPGEPAARVLDFGIAHSIGAPRATTAGSVVGSAIYLSPEQARGETVGPASDVYSLGLVLIESLTGRPAFAGTGAEAVVARISRPPALDDPAVAASASLLARMTALEPDDRPSAAEVARELAQPAATRLLPATSAAAPTERMPTAADATEPLRAAGAGVATPAPRTSRLRPGAAVGILAGVLLAVLGTVAVVGLPRTPDPEPTPTPAEEVADTPAPAPVSDPADDAGPRPGPGNGPGKDEKGKDDKAGGPGKK